LTRPSFAGCARHESRGWWKRQGAIEAMLEPQPAGKDYRLLKVVTREASAEELARSGKNRVPLLAAVEVSLP